MPSAKTDEGQIAGDRLESLGGVRRGLDVRHAMRVKGRRGRQHDEERDNIGRAHADHGVEPYALKLSGSLSRRFENRLRGRVFLDVLDLFRRLPEKEIGADRRAEDGDDHGEIGGRPFDMRNDEMVGDRSPWHANDEHRGDIGQQREREPAQHGDVARVAHEDFEEHDQNGERRHIEPLRSGQNELQRRRHRSKVGADVDDIGEDQQADQPVEQIRRIIPPHVGGDALARHPPDLGADHLDRAHERIGKKEGPGEGVAEGRARLRVGRDAAGVVVRSAGYQPRTENVGKLRAVRPLDLTGARIVAVIAKVGSVPRQVNG